MTKDEKELKVINDDNLNIESVETTGKYAVENNRLILTRYEYKKIVYKKYMVPYKEEINSILYKYHNENNHKESDDTIEAIKG